MTAAAAGPPLVVTRQRPDSLKIHQLLRDAIRARPTAMDTALVSFRDPLEPDTALIYRVIGKNPARRPTPAMLRAVSDSLVARRAPHYQRQASMLRGFGAIVLPPRYRLSQALLVVIRLSAIDTLSRDPEIIHIAPLHGGGPPAGPCGDTGTTHAIAAKALGLAGTGIYAGDLEGEMALLDTGVRRSHLLLQPSQGGGTPPPLDGIYRCVTGACFDESASQVDVDRHGHGTSTAAILAANDAMGSPWRGLTRARLDSYRVYDPPGAVGPAPLNWGGAPFAFDHAVLDDPHYLIVAEIADDQGNTALTTGANYAFDLGALVVAANGNSHLDESDVIPPPANATRAIGVGMYCIKDQVFDRQNTRGTTTDGRGKPDVGGLTSIYTAKGKPDDQAMHSYGGTSGATPTVAAVALLLRNWMRGTSDYVHPGQVYAGLILCGRSGFVHPQQGAGLIKVPDSGRLWWGQADLYPGDSLEIELPQEGLAVSRFDAAIWWPEYGTSNAGMPAAVERAKIGLQLQDPGRTTTSKSEAPGSVFQRTWLKTPSVNAQIPWHLTLLGNYVPPGSMRTVFWAVWGH